jgi:hypothetical protein
MLIMENALRKNTVGRVYLVNNSKRGRYGEAGQPPGVIAVAHE